MFYDEYNKRRICCVCNLLSGITQERGGSRVEIAKEKEKILRAFSENKITIKGSGILTLLYSALNSTEDQEESLALTTRDMIQNYITYLLTDTNIREDDTRLFYRDGHIDIPFSNTVLLEIEPDGEEYRILPKERCDMWSEENALTYYAEFFCGVKSPMYSYRGDVLIMAVLQNWVENRDIIGEKLTRRDIWEFAALLDCALFKVAMNAGLGSSKNICLRILDHYLGYMYDSLERSVPFRCRSGEYLLQYFRDNVNIVRDTI